MHLPNVKATPGLAATSGLSRAIIDTATSGDNSIVAAVAGQTTRVHRLRLYVAAAVTIEVKRGTTVLETIPFQGAGALVFDFQALPYYETAANEAFVLNLSAAIQVDGVCEYVTGA